MTDVNPSGAVHPVASLFPLLDGEDLQDLADDIRANGSLHRLVLDAEGTLVAGRNRWEVGDLPSRWATSRKLAPLR